MLWNIYKSVFFVAMGVAVACGILFRLMPEYQETWGTIGRVSLAIGVIPLCAVLIPMFLIWILDFIERIDGWLKKRNWGHIFTLPGAIGLILLVCLDGPDVVRAQAETDTRLVIILAVVSFALLGTGWFINHFPIQNRIVRDWSIYDS